MLLVAMKRGSMNGSPVNTVPLPVRWWADTDTFGYKTIHLPVAHTAFVLIDCDGTLDPNRYDSPIKQDTVAPALATARRAGMPVAYFHNAVGGEGGPANTNYELHGLREGKNRSLVSGWKPIQPTYPDILKPHPSEPEFQKAHRNGFRDTFADQYFRTWQIDTLVVVGFSLKSCVYHTCVGAHEHNYRVIVLRDGVCPPGTKEYRDTRDENNVEGGWMRFVTLRLIESNLGYTATSEDFIQACTSVA